MEADTVKLNWLVPPQVCGNRLTYAPRSVQPLGRGEVRGIAYKIYAMWSDRFSSADLPPAKHLQQAVATGLADWDTQGDHPIAFAILHLANDGSYLLLTRWNNANNLRHRVFSVAFSADRELQLAPLQDPYTIACIWETRLMLFEVNAWIEEILLPCRDALTPLMLERYLDRQFQGYV